jgi:hypothetical protein
MRKINLKAYPKFWMDFAQRCADIDPSMAMSSYQVKRYLLEWYGITVHITSTSEWAQVYMLDKDYTGFMLKWS